MQKLKIANNVASFFNAKALARSPDNSNLNVFSEKNVKEKCVENSLL
jgi:hypothetical protein